MIISTTFLFKAFSFLPAVKRTAHSCTVHAIQLDSTHWVTAVVGWSCSISATLFSGTSEHSLTIGPLKQNFRNLNALKITNNSYNVSIPHKVFFPKMPVFNFEDPN